MAEIFALKSSIDSLTQRCDAPAKSQDFLSKKYDSVIETIQKSNSQDIKNHKKYKEVTDSLEQKHASKHSKKVKNPMIIKFLQREKREEFYKRRRNLVGKKSHLPSQSVAVNECVV